MSRVTQGWIVHLQESGHTGAELPEGKCMGLLTIYCPLCRKVFSSDLDNDPDLVPSPTIRDRFYKRCPNCAGTVAFVRTVGGQLLIRDTTPGGPVTEPAALDTERFPLDCPFCRAVLSSDIENDPTVLASPHDEGELYKHCPSCWIKVKLTKLSDGRLGLATWN